MTRLLPRPRMSLASSLALGALPFAALAGVAQEGGTAASAGWIGVRVEERYNCGWETSEDWKNCTLILRIREMQEGGPAERAGLRAGDRLATMDGVELTLANLPDRLASIRASVPVRLDVTRDGVDHSFEVLPEVRPPDADAVPMVGRRTVVATAGSRQRNTFVLWLTDPAEGDRPGFALTVRDTEDIGVAVEPSAVRVVDGRLNLLPVRDRSASELPAVRREVLSDLRRESESAYRNFTVALERVGAVRARLSPAEFRRRAIRIAELALAETELAVRFQRTFAGAEFEPVRNFSDRRGLDGLLVLRVAGGTVTDRLGLGPGDLLVRAGDRPIRDVEDLVAALESARNEGLGVVWVRGGEEMSGVWPRR
ncbi:MAG: PDZ domain-containing protein [Gemmatimonadales bacterium]|nr:PDZ domain-containing protein [Gemmatimonadales bacterium]MYG50443.1 PDZ domain-containing protein [Gemmatimonadales bacterium]MYK00581.1 PDZ domain-containing protein [Candidatus Palauibacter ramosifaciens]